MIINGIVSVSRFSYKPRVLFVGHKETVQTQTRRRRTRRLIRVSTICLQNVWICIKMKNTTQQPLKQIWTVGCWVVFFPYYSNLKRNFCKQTVEQLILHCLRMSHKKDARLILVNKNSSCPLLFFHFLRAIKPSKIPFAVNVTTKQLSIIKKNACFNQYR